MADKRQECLGRNGLPYKEETMETDTAFCGGKKMCHICKIGRCLGEKTKLISV